MSSMRVENASREDGVGSPVGRRSLGCSLFLDKAVGFHSVLSMDHSIHCVPVDVVVVVVDRLDRCHTFLDVSDQSEEIP